MLLSAFSENGRKQKGNQELRCPCSNVCNAEAGVIDRDAGVEQIAGGLGVQPMIVIQTRRWKSAIVGFWAKDRRVPGRGAVIALEHVCIFDGGGVRRGHHGWAYWI